MGTALKLIVCVTTLLSCWSSEAANSGKLLPTAPLAKQVDTLSLLLSQSPGETVESRRNAGFAVRDKISQFIVDRAEAKLDITKEQPGAQLQAVLCANPNAECDCNHPPIVIANTWFGPKGTSQFVVA